MEREFSGHSLSFSPSSRRQVIVGCNVFFSMKIKTAISDQIIWQLLIPSISSNCFHNDYNYDIVDGGIGDLWCSSGIAVQSDRPPLGGQRVAAGALVDDVWGHCRFSNTSLVSISLQSVLSIMFYNFFVKFKGAEGFQIKTDLTDDTKRTRYWDGPFCVQLKI